MYISRKEDLSIFYWLQDKFSAYLSMVKIVDGFPMENLTIPTISVDAKTINAVDYQLGDLEGYRRRVFQIDIFAKNKAQRDEFAYKIFEELAGNIPVYDYDQGFPPISVPRIGTLVTLERRLDIIQIFPELVENLYYRSSILFIARNDYV
jgi:hypothetical protein